MIGVTPLRLLPISSTPTPSTPILSHLSKPCLGLLPQELSSALNYYIYILCIHCNILNLCQESIAGVVYLHLGKSLIQTDMTEKQCLSIIEILLTVTFYLI